MNNPASVQQISECFIKPQHISKEAEQPLYLSQWDLSMLSAHYIQKGLIFNKPSDFSVTIFLKELKDSLSTTLTHFYPLAARLATQKQADPPSYIVYIDLKNSPGAKLVHATLDLTVSDILSPSDVPLIVQSFFDHDRAINHDGHSTSLLTIQVTELIDGIFIGCSINHMVVDGTSYWHFFNALSETFKSDTISRSPVHNRWIPDGYGPIINLPFTNHDQFISRHDDSPHLREKIFHFSADSLSKLKANANSESNTTKISSLQALSALMWRCITRVRNLPLDRETSCRLIANNRSRLVPPLSDDYFGNSIQAVKGTSKAGELLDHDLGWAAWLIHKAVVDHNDKTVRNSVESWFKNPIIYQFRQFFDPNSIVMGSSPRFDMYRNEFGLGKALAIRSGYALKHDGSITIYPGLEGMGSMDLGICLLPHFMSAFESDEELLSAL